MLVEEHAQAREGLAALQLLPSNGSRASMMATAKDHNLGLGNADGESIGHTEALHEV